MHFSGRLLVWCLFAFPKTHGTSLLLVTVYLVHTTTIIMANTSKFLVIVRMVKQGEQYKNAVAVCH
jgi:hypothetical protein